MINHIINKYLCEQVEDCTVQYGRPVCLNVFLIVLRSLSVLSTVSNIPVTSENMCFDFLVARTQLKKSKHTYRRGEVTERGASLFY